MSANTVSIISGGTTYYFNDGSGAPTAYNGSNTPWTAAGTSCFRLTYNDAGPTWIPQPAHPQIMWSGGPPLGNGRWPLSKAYDNRTESTGVNITATTKNNAIFLLRFLRQLLNTALYTTPCVLAVQSGTNTGYAEIFSADIDENSLYLVEPEGEWRAVITWTITPFCGLLSTSETLINAVSFQNQFTGSPDNQATFSTGTGDLIQEGSPLNITLTATTNNWDGYIYLGSVSSIATTASTQTVTTSSTTGATAASGNTLTINPTLANGNGLKLRVFAQSSSVSGSCEYRLRIYFSAGGATSTGLWYTSQWIAPTVNSTLLDSGNIPISFYQNSNVTSLYALLEVRSLSGGSVTVTLNNLHVVHYYTMCRLQNSAGSVSTTDILYLNSFRETSGRPVLPYQTLVCWTTTSGGTPVYQYNITGVPPQYYAGASLFVASIVPSTWSFSTNRVATITAKHAPLYRTVRGGA